MDGAPCGRSIQFMAVTAASRVRAAGAGAFGGLSEYLAARFGPEAAAATIQPLSGDPDQVKEGGYGIPWLVEWPTPAGRRRLVLETVRAGGFGHEDRADRAALAVRALDDYGRLPRHVVAVDAGVLREGAPPLSLHGGGEFFLLTEFSGGEPYADDLERIAAEGDARPRDRKRARHLAEFAVRTAGAFDGPFAELFRLFWAAYHEASPDSGLAEVIAPFYAFRVLVLASPLWYPNESEKTREQLVRFLVSILEAPRFEPDRIPAYLDGRPA